MILAKYILRNHLSPFLFSNVTLIGIFLLQFLMKFADRLVGKGIDTWIVIKLIGFNLAWMVVLVVPMSTLVASLMAFGAMSQNNEITIIKSSGVSLYKMMLPPFLVSILVAYLLILFNNDVLPDANHQAKILMQDISRKKPTLSLEPGVFSQEVSNYAILVRDINEQTNILTDVTIYDYSNPSKINVVTAKKGRLYFSANQEKLIMNLQEGEIHESESSDTNLYRKLVFDRHRITMDAEQFSFQQSAPGGPRGDRELSTNDMLAIIDSMKNLQQKSFSQVTQQVNKYFYIDTISIQNTELPQKSNNKELVYTRALENVKTAKNIILSNFNKVNFYSNEINKYRVEIHKKYSLPVACLVFILIGAPLGVMTKKGGFGVAASISLFFFLVYWAFLIGGEKLADRGILSPILGMWAANILIASAGILVTIKTVRDTVELKFTFLKKLLPKQWRNIEENSNEADR